MANESTVTLLCYSADMEKFTIKKPILGINKTIRLPEDLAERLERLAAKNEISFNQLVVQCCNFALDNLDNDIQN